MHTYTVCSVNCCLFLNRRQTNTRHSQSSEHSTADEDCLRLRLVFASLSTQPNQLSTKFCVILYVVTYSWHVPISIVAFCFASSCAYAMYTYVRTSVNVYTVHVLTFFHAHTYKYRRRFITKSHRTQFSECSRK